MRSLRAQLRLPQPAAEDEAEGRSETVIGAWSFRFSGSARRWGTDEEIGLQWLRVTDDGVGMTGEVITNYFTQIGKGYYNRFATTNEPMLTQSVV